VRCLPPLRLLAPLVRTARDELSAGGDRRGVAIGTARALAPLLRALQADVAGDEAALGADAAALAPAWAAAQRRLQAQPEPIFALPAVDELVRAATRMLEDCMRVEDGGATPPPADA
jgi:hypothetical protein